MRSYQAIILAAGRGKRMKTGENKQFINISGRPLILHTLDVFLQDSWCTAITLVVNPKDEERMRGLLESVSSHKDIRLVMGGEERQQSVFCGLKSMKGYTGIVFIHDGARPFVANDHLHALAEATVENRAALLAVPVTDTIKQVVNGRLRTLDRKTLWAAQTPQSFDFELIYQIHQQAAGQGILGTDDASLAEHFGYDVGIVQGSYHNIKITTPEDLGKAQAFFGK
ncbi:2-C-methyl-D-erythritol 4-phosphate cytidylyltransferase [Sediminibacillus dalangtanensis]|uniref:2-C-methyl-D-erythritol 4-phosphate cytidylyltransferase n=1 Tax=Sediminibacillus dalangtanensis TaxID=2729421 RepID=A0ABX7VWF0_9BACI|nr:2-C-methyl-D-erythritol 4-phosphate cytidylyltransferase [Sediminibacillus dalangtanensis]QTN01300.1 2-C-methyl-D-erythritol 4-phosphate cytidylyltransferase [Sediminibacillus dalangtanensis]